MDSAWGRGVSDLDRLPVVRVRRDGGRGYRLINERDFDPAVHELYVEDGAMVESQPEQRRRGRPPKARAAEEMSE